MTIKITKAQREYNEYVEQNKNGVIEPLSFKEWDAINPDYKVKKHLGKGKYLYVPTELLPLNKLLHEYLSTLAIQTEVQDLKELREQYDAKDLDDKVQKEVGEEIETLVNKINKAATDRTEIVMTVSLILKDMKLLIYEPENKSLVIMSKIINFKKRMIPTSIFFKEVIEAATMDVAMSLLMENYAFNDTTVALMNAKGRNKLYKNRAFFKLEEFKKAH